LSVFLLLFAGATVFMMQAGFAMLCAGSVRQKNVKNIMLKNLLDACGGAIGFYTIGYAFAYGTNDSGGKSFIGTSNFFIRNFSTGPEYIMWFFQFAFAATAATIVAGTVAERCKMAAYLCYSVFLTGFVSELVLDDEPHFATQVSSTSSSALSFTHTNATRSTLLWFTPSGVGTDS
jgi:ammonium transporter, Amt family